jgi:hypothetical protein
MLHTKPAHAARTDGADGERDTGRATGHEALLAGMVCRVERAWRRPSSSSTPDFRMIFLGIAGD